MNYHDHHYYLYLRTTIWLNSTSPLAYPPRLDGNEAHSFIVQAIRNHACMGQLGEKPWTLDTNTNLRSVIYYRFDHEHNIMYHNHYCH